MKVKNLAIGFIIFIQSISVFAYENIVTHSNSVAITFDACDGKTDFRILELIKEKKIPVTLFVTTKWINKNPEAIDFIIKNSKLFKIENHGTDHLEAILNKKGLYGLSTVKNIKGLEHEVLNNRETIKNVFKQDSNYYRTAGALYDDMSLNWLREQGIKVGGYTIAADEGAKASKEKIIKNLTKVKNGDVILMHINHPSSQVYDGFKEGLIVMQEKNIQFEFLKD